MRKAFLRLARLTEEGGYARHPVAWDAEQLRPVHSILEQFVERRLLVTRAESGTRMVEVAHEALFRSWTPLKTWLDNNRAELLLQQQIKRDAMAWQASRRAAENLWRGGRLLEARELLRNGQLATPECEFVRAGLRRRWVQRLTVAGGTLAVIAVLAVLLVRAEKAAEVAEQQTIIATRQSALAEERRQVAEQQTALAREQRQQAEDAREDAERELLRARSAELRAMMQRLTVLRERLDPDSDQVRLRALEAERKAIETRLVATTRAHQVKLGNAIGFRGDFDFLARWEGHASSVRLQGESVYIDPLTNLGFAKPEGIRARYGFILTPDELEAVTSVVGLRGRDAQAAFEERPVLKRVRLEPFDVARLIPEVVEPHWNGLLKRFPSLSESSIPAPVHTALLSLAVNVGSGNRVWKTLGDAIVQQDWSSVADGIEDMTNRGIYQRFPGLVKRRKAEAALIRRAIDN